MALQSNAPTSIAPSTHSCSANRIASDSLGFNPASFSTAEREIAMDAIAQIIPHLDLQDCRQIAELVDAQTTLIEILGDRQAASPIPLEHHCVA